MLQPFDHRVEAGGQLAHLVVGMHLDPARQVLGLLNVPRGLRYLGQWGEHAPGGHPAQSGGERDPARAHHQQDESEVSQDAVDAVQRTSQLDGAGLRLEADAQRHREGQLADVASADLHVGHERARAALRHRVHARVDGQADVAAGRPVLRDQLVVLGRPASAWWQTGEGLTERGLAILLDGGRLRTKRAVDLAEELAAHHQVAHDRGGNDSKARPPRRPPGQVACAAAWLSPAARSRRP